MRDEPPSRWFERQLRELCRPVVIFGLAAAILLGICGRVYLLRRPLGLGMNNVAGLSATPGTHEMYFWRVSSTPPKITGTGSLLGFTFATRTGTGGVWVQELHVAFWSAFASLLTMWLMFEVALRAVRRRRRRDPLPDGVPATAH